MGKELKPIGRAVASAKGHYPMADGRVMTIKPGEVFTVFEGMTKALWFTVLPNDAPEPKPAEPVAPPPDPDTLAAVAGVERKFEDRLTLEAEDAALALEKRVIGGKVEAAKVERRRRQNAATLVQLVALLNERGMGEVVAEAERRAAEALACVA